MPDEFSALNTVFLAVKYNPEALEKILKLAKDHGLLDQIIQEKDANHYNILQFATLNKTADSLKYVQSSPQNISIYFR